MWSSTTTIKSVFMRSLRLCRSFATMNVTLAKQHCFKPTFYDYSCKDAILYALGVGATPVDSSLKYVFEEDSNFSVLPTFAVVPSFAVIKTLDSVPGLAWNWSKILHGEQYIRILKPFSSKGRLRSQARIADILDKGKGALILVNVDTFDAETSDHLSQCQYSIFQVDAGGFPGGERTSDKEIQVEQIPNRAPDAVQEEPTYVHQAALYRQVAGDLNPLHIDPLFASKAGFKSPILHGLCTLGFAARHVLHQYAADNVRQFRALKVRFSKPVIPGQVLVTEMWSGVDHGTTVTRRVHFQTKTKDNNMIVLACGYVDLGEGIGDDHDIDAVKNIEIKE